jgi:hypothetical protein
MTLQTIEIAGVAGAFQRVRGGVDGEMLLAENRRMFFEETDTFRRCRFWYADFTGSDLAGVSAEHIKALREIAEEAAVLQPELAVAIVAPEDLQFALGRMWSLLAELTGWRTGTFRTPEEACRWLSENLGHSFTSAALPRDEDQPKRPAR